MATPSDDPTGPRLSPSQRGAPEPRQQPGVGVTGVGAGTTAPPAWSGMGGTFDPMAGAGPVYGMDDTPPWAVPDAQAPAYDLYTSGGLSEAASSNRVDLTARGHERPRFGSNYSQDTIRTVAAKFWEMDTDQRASWQKRMYDAGFLAEEPPSWGQPDPRGQDFSAWLNMAKTAARLRIPMDELADQLAESGAGDALRGGSGGPQRRRPDIPLTSRVDAKRIAEAVGVELMGRAPTSAETKRAISRLHALEKGAGQRQGDAYMSDEGGATYESGPSAQAAIEADLERQNPEEVRAHDTVEQFAGFLQILGG